MNVVTRVRPPAGQLPGSNEACWCGSREKYKKCHRSADSAALRTERAGDAAAGPRLKPGRISPMRAVPAHIPRPDYALSGRPGPLPPGYSEVMAGEKLERMRRACRAAAEILRETARAIRPGVTTDALDAVAHEETLKRGGYPSPLNYHGFPKSLCTSVNEVICHGIPDDRPLEAGDIVNLDVTIYLDGMHGDTNATFFVGGEEAADPTSRKLVAVTRESLQRGIAAVRPGKPIWHIGQAIQQYAEGQGFGVVRAYCGHSIGERFHGALQIPHTVEEPRNETLMVPGMVFTIEPMITVGTWDYRVWDDGWTAVTRDSKRTAQFEHTVHVTEDGAEVLTAQPE